MSTNATPLADGGGSTATTDVAGASPVPAPLAVAGIAGGGGACAAPDVGAVASLLQQLELAIEALQQALADDANRPA